MDGAMLVPLVKRMDRKWRKRLRDDEILNEAAELAHYCRHQDLMTIERAVDRVIEREPHYPTPRKLMDAIAEVLEIDARRKPAKVVPDGCDRCQTPYQPRYWWRRPRSAQDISEAMAPSNPHKGFVRRGGRTHCDCSWRKMIKLYLHDDELGVLFLEDEEDPIVQDEIRSRGSPAPKRQQLALMVESVGRPIERGDAYEEPPTPTGHDVRKDLGWSDEQPLPSADVCTPASS